MFIEQNRFANCKYKNGSGCKISAKSEKLQYFALFAILAVKITNFSKMNIVFNFETPKLFSVQNFSQIGETTIFCPFGVRITNFSKMIKCSQNRIDLQIVNTKTVLGAKFQPNQRNYNILPFLPFWVQNYKLFKNGLHFQIICTKTVLGTKFQPNQRNYNILPFLPFWGQNYELFKND